MIDDTTKVVWQCAENMCPLVRDFSEFACRRWCNRCTGLISVEGCLCACFWWLLLDDVAVAIVWKVQTIVLMIAQVGTASEALMPTSSDELMSEKISVFACMFGRNESRNSNFIPCCPHHIQYCVRTSLHFVCNTLTTCHAGTVDKTRKIADFRAHIRSSFDHGL